MTTLNAESFEFKAPPAVIRHARNYIAKMPEAIAGEGGHPATFAVACKLVQGFGLKFDDALQLMLEYNVRCVPPWSLPELKHKITDALGLPVDDRGEAYLLKPKRDSQPDALPYVRNRRPFTQEDIFALARLRRIQPHGIKFAAEKGFLFRTNWFGDECFGVTDSAGLLIELRRMDGQPFAAPSAVQSCRAQIARGPAQQENLASGNPRGPGIPLHRPGRRRTRFPLRPP